MLKINLLPPYIHQRKQVRLAIVVVTLVVAAEVAAMVALRSAPLEKKNTLTATRDSKQQELTKLQQIGTDAQKVTGEEAAFKPKFDFFEGMEKYNAAYPDLYRHTAGYTDREAMFLALEAQGNLLRIEAHVKDASDLARLMVGLTRSGRWAQDPQIASLVPLSLPNQVNPNTGLPDSPLIIGSSGGLGSVSSSGMPGMGDPGMMMGGSAMMGGPAGMGGSAMMGDPAAMGGMGGNGPGGGFGGGGMMMGGPSAAGGMGGMGGMGSSDSFGGGGMMMGGPASAGDMGAMGAMGGMGGMGGNGPGGFGGDPGMAGAGGMFGAPGLEGGTGSTGAGLAAIPNFGLARVRPKGFLVSVSCVLRKPVVRPTYGSAGQQGGFGGGGAFGGMGSGMMGDPTAGMSGGMMGGAMGGGMMGPGMNGPGGMGDTAGMGAGGPGMMAPGGPGMGGPGMGG